MVTIYEAGPGTVRVEGSVYDEFITISEGKLILAPDSGGEDEYRVGDSLIMSKGYIGAGKCLRISRADYGGYPIHGSGI
jgi:uncharacterized cupin superfamily protein